MSNMLLEIKIISLLIYSNLLVDLLSKELSLVFKKMLLALGSFVGKVTN